MILDTKKKNNDVNRSNEKIDIKKLHEKKVRFYRLSRWLETDKFFRCLRTFWLTPRRQARYDYGGASLLQKCNISLKRDFSPNFNKNGHETFQTEYLSFLLTLNIWFANLRLWKSVLKAVGYKNVTAWRSEV